MWKKCSSSDGVVTSFAILLFLRELYVALFCFFSMLFFSQNVLLCGSSIVVFQIYMSVVVV